MEEKTDQQGSVVESLTNKEQWVLHKALKKVEAEIFQNVVRKLGAWVGVVMSLLFIGGCLYINSWSSNVENSAVQKLVDDPVLRDKIIQRLADSEKEAARVVSTLTYDVEQIRLMLDRIRKELSTRSPSNPSNQTSEEGNKKQ